MEEDVTVEPLKKTQRRLTPRITVIVFTIVLDYFFGIFNLEGSGGPSEVLYSPLRCNDIYHGGSMDFLSISPTSRFLKENNIVFQL
jgi:hypothetical protein